MLRRSLALARAPASRVLSAAAGRRQLMVASPTLIQQVQASATSDPHLNCFKMVTDGADPVMMTYRDLQRQIDAFAHGMQGAKFGPQHKIVIWAKDCAENVVAQLGAAKAGVTVEVLGDGASAAELEKALSGARALLFSPTLLPEEGALKTVRTLIPELDGLPERADQLVYSAKFPNLRWVFNTGFERVPGMLKFEYILAYKKENPTTASMGSIAFAGPGSKKDLSIPYLDPEAKTPVVEPSREVA